MEIMFQGLIVHTTINKNGTDQQVAVLVAATNHAAKLAYKLKDDPSSGGASGTACKNLSGCIMTDAGVGVPARVDLADLPRLTCTTTGTSTDATLDLLNCPPVSGQIVAIVFLPPGGRLSCDHYFDEEVTFNNPHGPMPETVKYAVNIAGNVKITYGPKPGDELTLSGSAKINITNVCPPPHPPPPPPPPHNHYQYYKNFFQTPAAITVYNPRKNGKLCTYASQPEAMPNCTGGSTLDVDCVNSRFP